MTATIAPPRPFLATDRQVADPFPVSSAPVSSAPVSSAPVSSAPVSSEYTISETAEILDMSIECLNDLIKIGLFECRQEDGERFILRSTVLEFHRTQVRREAALNELSRWDQEMGLYD